MGLRSIALALIALVGACGVAQEAPPSSTSKAASAITNGTNDDADPAVVALVDASGTVVCSGTLISPHVVLTAAHCSIGPTTYYGFRAFFGSSTASGAGTFIALSDARVHPQFDSATFANDVAVVALASRAIASPIAALASTPDSTFTGATVRVVGFGATTGGAQDSGRKRSGTATVSSVAATTIELAAAPSQPCSGDSGGPGLLTVAGTEYVAAVTSHGDVACTAHDFDTRVDAFLTSFVQPYVDAAIDGAAHAGERCFYPEHCDRGTCVVADDSPDIMYCAPPCAMNSDCPTAMTCTSHDGTSQCRYPIPTPGAIGSKCAASSDCVAGECLASGVCSRRCVTNTDCPAAYACENVVDIQFDCIAVPASPPNDSSCSASPHARGSFAWAMLFVIGAIAIARRRTADADEPTSSAARMTRAHWIALGVILSCALVLRLAHVNEMRADVLFEHPVLDEDRYVTDARTMAHGGPAPVPFWQPPGILYALALMTRAMGQGLLGPRIVQALVGVATCAFAFAIARRLFTTRVGLASAAVVAIHGVLVFAGGELLPAVWSGALDLAAILLLLDARRSLAHAAGAGLALGVSAVFAPTILPFALIAAIWIWRGGGNRPGERVAAFVAAMALAIVPVTYTNYGAGREVIVVSSNGGANFFIGNNAHYDETFALRPGIHWTELAERPRREAHLSRPGESSSWFFREGFAFWRAHPIDAIALYARKLYLFFHGAEIPRDADVYAARDGSRVLRALIGPRPLWLPDGLLVPLALVGIATAWHERRSLVNHKARAPEGRAGLALPLLFLASQAIVLAAFFVTSRYRVPSLPILAIFAVVGVIAIARASSTKQRVALVALTAVLAIALGVPTRETALSFGAEADLYRGLAYARHFHDPDRAIAYYRRAIDRDPRDARPWFELGNALEAGGRLMDATTAWERAAACDPSDLRPRRFVAMALLRNGDPEGAARSLEASIAAAARDPSQYSLEHFQLAGIYADAGDAPRALDELRFALRADRTHFRSSAPGFARKYRDHFGDADFWRAFDDMMRDAARPAP